MTDASAPRIEGFEYVRFLGEGGQAEVYQYKQLSPQRPVAVKVMRAAFLSEVDQVEFLHEADTLASLDHPNIMTIYQAGQTADGRPYLVMRYFPEENLADLAARATLRLGEVLRIAINLASAVDFAHDAGVIHCDIKPQNVLLDSFGPALSDFGIASRARRKSRDASFSMTWAPPEAFTDGELTIASDIYSLGATIWYALLGHAPFTLSESDDPARLVDAVLHSGLPPMTRADVPAELESLLVRMLAKFPANRPSSARDVVLELKEIERQLGFAPTAVPFVQYSEDTIERRANIGIGPPVPPSHQPVSDHTLIRPLIVQAPHDRSDREQFVNAPPNGVGGAPSRLQRRLIVGGFVAAFVLLSGAAVAIVLQRNDKASAVTGETTTSPTKVAGRKPASQVVRVLPLNGAPSEVTTDGKRVYVVSGVAGTVVSLPMKGDRIVSSWQSAAGTFSIAADSSKGQLYLADLDGDKVLSLSSQSGQTESSTNVGSDPFRVALDATAGRLYVSNGGDGTVSVIDTRTFREVATVQVGDGPAGIAVDATAGRVYVANRRSGTVSVIDSGTNKVLKTIRTGDWPFRVTADPEGNRAFVMNAHGHTVSVIDASSLRVTATLRPGRGPVGGVIDRAAGVLYVTLADDNSVAEINLRDLSLGPSIAVGDGPSGIALDPKTGRVYVVNRDSHDVSVLER